MGKNLCYTFVRFSICVCPTICISVGTHSVSTHEINVIDPKRWRKSTAHTHTHVGDVLFLLYSIYLRDYLHLHMWSAVFDQTSCEFNAFLHVTSYMCHECYMKSQIITQANVFFLILYTTSVFVASVCRGSFSSMTVLLRDLTLNLQPNDQEKCFSVLFCKPVSCCDNVVLIFWIS